MAPVKAPGAEAVGAEDAAGPVVTRVLKDQILHLTKRKHDMFVSNHGMRAQDLEVARKTRTAVKTRDEYWAVKDLPPPPGTATAKPDTTGADGDDAAKAHLKQKAVQSMHEREAQNAASGGGDGENGVAGGAAGQLALYKPHGGTTHGSTALMVRAGKTLNMPRPEWHAPWKLMRVISGHLGWVRCIHVEPGNEWFATGAGDRTVKIWDLASGELKLTLTGHISPVRGITVSDRHPYMFTVGEDKLVKCWDLETNKVMRHYHGHLSGVYSCALHPTLDVLCTGGRDCAVRVWDIRSKNQIFCLAGHKDTVGSLACQSVDPQIISGSHDTCLKLWDLAAGKAYTTLTHHKKSVRALAMHPTKFIFASGSADNIKQWKMPEGTFMKNMDAVPYRAIVNCMAVNHDDVTVAGYDNGALRFMDWKTGYNFHTEMTRVQPGSLESEAGIFACSFDKTGSRLITAEADKTIKVWKEDENATPQTHPIDWTAAAPGTEKRW